MPGLVQLRHAFWIQAFFIFVAVIVFVQKLAVFPCVVHLALIAASAIGAHAAQRPPDSSVRN